MQYRGKTKAGNTITDQDYRGVYATKYTTLVLADKKKKAANPTNHDLYGANSGTAKVAIDKIPDYELSYKSTTGLDMKPLVVTCYKDEATKATHQTMSDKDIERAMEDAKAYESEDQEKRDAIESYNEGQNMLYKGEAYLAQHKKELSREQRSELKSAISDLKHSMKRIKPQNITEEQGRAIKEASERVNQLIR